MQPGTTNLSSKKDIIDRSVEVNSNHKEKFENNVAVTKASSEFSIPLYWLIPLKHVLYLVSSNHII